LLNKAKSSGTTLAQLLKRPEVQIESLVPVLVRLMPEFFERARGQGPGAGGQKIALNRYQEVATNEEVATNKEVVILSEVSREANVVEGPLYTESQPESSSAACEPQVPPRGLKPLVGMTIHNDAKPLVGMTIHREDEPSLQMTSSDEKLEAVGNARLATSNWPLATALSPNPQPLSPDFRLSAEIRNELKSVETEIKYSGYLDQQTKAIERLKKSEQRTIPDWFDYGKVSGLSREMNEKLSRVRPRTLGQASRIPGVTPAAVSLINVYIEIQARQNAVTPSQPT